MARRSLGRSHWARICQYVRIDFVWQPWDPLDWCYGDFLYGDPKLDEEPYKQQDYKQYVKQCLLREELEYDTYVGENYKAEEYGINHWKHDPDVADLLNKAQRAKCCERREPVTNADPAVFGINRFRNIELLSSYCLPSGD